MLEYNLAASTFDPSDNNFPKTDRHFRCMIQMTITCSLVLNNLLDLYEVFRLKVVNLTIEETTRLQLL
jgi:hypothetical protein